MALDAGCWWLARERKTTKATHTRAKPRGEIKRVKTQQKFDTAKPKPKCCNHQANDNAHNI